MNTLQQLCTNVIIANNLEYNVLCEDLREMIETTYEEELEQSYNNMCNLCLLVFLCISIFALFTIPPQIQLIFVLALVILSSILV